MLSPVPLVRPSTQLLTRPARLSGGDQLSNSSRAVAISPPGAQALGTLPWAVTFTPLLHEAPPAAGYPSPDLTASQREVLLEKGPPKPPADLLDGIPDPASVEQQKMEFAKGIDEMLAQQTAVLAQKHQYVIDFLRAKNEQQKRHACAAIDEEVMKRELELEERCGEQMLRLSQAAQSRKMELARHASFMTVDYNLRRRREELSAEDYELHLRFFDASTRGVLNPLPTQLPPAAVVPGLAPPQAQGAAGQVPVGYARDASFTSDATRPPEQPQHASSGPPVPAAPSFGVSFPADPSFGISAGEAAGAAPGIAAGHVGTLYLVVHGCYNLLNRDTGIMGDVSDPFVAARVGKHEERTPTINNDLNPVWKEGNRFKFCVAQEDVALELEVFNANFIRNQSLGRASVDLRTVPGAQWTRLKERLADGGQGELEFDLRLEPETTQQHPHN